MNRRARDYGDPEHAFRPANPDALDMGPLFQSAVNPWPESPKVTDAEQRGLELPESIEAKYRAWRDTNEGTAVFRWLAARSTEQVANGATRLFIDKLIWPCRQDLGLSVNNSYRALLVRELIEQHPVLQGVFELRQRRAS